MRITLLGFSNDTGSQILESIHISYPKAVVSVIQNMPQHSEVPFLPAGMVVSFHQDLELEGPPDEAMFICAANTAAKRGIWDHFQKKWGISENQLCSILHPHAILASTSVIGNGVYVEPGCVISPFAQIFDMVTINRGVTIGHHTSIGPFSTINPGCHVAGHVKLGAGVQVGIGTMIFDHIKIGDGAVIGGGSVVNKDIPPGVLAFGNPCRVIKELDAQF